MKISDIMLDLATGDASVHDAYIQEAMGQVKVSAAIYEAANQISELNDYDRTQVVQECAEAGLPSDREGALELALESVGHELIGTCRHLYAEMAKFDERVSKPTSPYAAINTINHQLGGTMRLDGSLEFACEYAHLIAPKKGKVFILNEGAKIAKGKALKKLVANFIQGVSLLCNAFCLDTSAIFSKEKVKQVVPAPVSTKCAKSEDGKNDCTLSYMVSAISSANKYLKITDLKPSDFTAKPTEEDTTINLACDFTVAEFTKFVLDKLGVDLESDKPQGAKIEARIKKMIKECKKNRIPGAAKDLNKGDGASEIAMIVEFNENLHEIAKNIYKYFNDAADAIITSATN